MSKDNLPSLQRALVLQGGGALGAYEAGVFKALYNSIKNEIKNENENIFDIIAGTSIGAINAAFLVGYVIDKRKETTSVARSWEGSAKKLEEFWKLNLASTPSLVRWWPFYWDQVAWKDTWNLLNKSNHEIATGEAARRYYSAKEFIINGTPNVFSPNPLPITDAKFFDNYLLPYNLAPNIWYRYDNHALKETIRRSIHFPIATNFDQKQPRLLAISVDVEEGETVTFDSYKKEDGTRKSQYGDYDKKAGTYEQTIKYDKGLMPEHVMASASVPERYDYALVPVNYDYTNPETSTIGEMNLEGYRRFWDGGILSNTPLRELIQAHQDYWLSANNTSNTTTMPSLEIYIVDVWPSLDDYPVPLDLDGVRDRKNDLTYQDKTPYEEKVANLVSDYYSLSRDLLELAKGKGIPQKNLDPILSKIGKSKDRAGGNRTFKDLLFNQFNIEKVIRIERSPDTDDISNKWCDFSSATISHLLERGERDALNTIGKFH